MEPSRDAYMNRLSSGLTHLRESGKLCDTVLITADRQLLAHSIVLAAASPVFRAAFQTCAADGCSCYRLQLDGLDGQLMEAILNCIYCGHGVPVTSFSPMFTADSVAEICEQLGVSWIINNRDSSNLVHCNQQANRDKCLPLQLSANSTDDNSTLHDIFTDNKVAEYDSQTAISDNPEATMFLLNSAAETVSSSVTDEQRPFMCDICSQQFLTQATLRQHRNHHKHCATCADCGHSFSTSAVLRHHSLSQCSRKAVSCNICLESFKGWLSLARHSVTMHTEAYVCQLCGHAFLHFEQLLSHSSVHATNVYQCQSCPRSFWSRRRAEQHVMKHVTDCENGYGSESCLKEDISGNEWITESPVNLRNGDTSGSENWNINGDVCLTGHTFGEVINDTHIGYQQKEVTAAACALGSQAKEINMSQLALAPSLPHRILQMPLAGCNFPSSNGQLSGHRIVICSDNPHQPNPVPVADSLGRGAAVQNRVTCAKCCRTFKRLSDLHVHMRCHTGEMRYKCSVCDRPFRKNGTLARHMRVHTGDRPYICETCGKSYKLLFHLHLHMSVHSSDRPFSCEVCGKSFQSAASLKKHRFVHSGVKPFSCPICTRLFNRRSNMHAHMRVHDGARQHEIFGQEHVCILCRKKFDSMASLQQHLQTHARQIGMDVGETITADTDSSADVSYCSVEKQPTEDVYVALPLYHFDDFDVS